MQPIRIGQKSRGIVRYGDGNEYEGEFLIVLPHGKGELRDGKGNRYAGAFAYGDPQGIGIWTRPDGKTARGKWNASGKFEIEGEWE